MDKSVHSEYDYQEQRDRSPLQAKRESFVSVREYHRGTIYDRYADDHRSERPRHHRDREGRQKSSEEFRQYWDNRSWEQSTDHEGLHRDERQQNAYSTETKQVHTSVDQTYNKDGRSEDRSYHRDNKAYQHASVEYMYHRGGANSPNTLPQPLPITLNYKTEASMPTTDPPYNHADDRHHSNRGVRGETMSRDEMVMVDKLIHQSLGDRKPSEMLLKMANYAPPYDKARKVFMKHLFLSQLPAPVRAEMADIQFDEGRMEDFASIADKIVQMNILSIF